MDILIALAVSVDGLRMVRNVAAQATAAEIAAAYLTIMPVGTAVTIESE